MLCFILLFFLVFAIEFNPQQDRTSINLLVILVGTGILQMGAGLSGGVYRKWCLDALEGSFAVNIIILAASNMYISTILITHKKTSLPLGTPLSP